MAGMVNLEMAYAADEVDSCRDAERVEDAQRSAVALSSIVRADMWMRRCGGGAEIKASEEGSMSDVSDLL